MRENPLLLLHRIVASIRAPGVVPEDFIVGVKLNAADYIVTEVNGGDTCDTLYASPPHAEDERALEHIREIAAWGSVDLIEISGGDYENPGQPSMILVPVWPT